MNTSSYTVEFVTKTYNMVVPNQDLNTEKTEAMITGRNAAEQEQRMGESIRDFKVVNRFKYFGAIFNSH